ncbi:hypothetical protein [Aurantimonas endophytica]|uniref:Phosphotransferase family enzyme n=1 Tax=Aurantimonas endophytica TaxID=1522175 RepID=A0A7W6HGP0_9HYPH|nr:hypothetical protein [Aurantimonas endophytica]MBB4004822.1 hypothetical protein [Aurantimonas endophytica]MCO6405632.1 hypothetical protein [Aurantimonas endophytica]
MKVFDFARGVILTTTSREEWADFQKAHALKLFHHVPTASSDLWESKEGLFRRDDMLPARPIVLLPTRTQELAYREFIRCYGGYIAAHRKPPRPDIILESYGEFFGVLSDDLRSHLRQWEQKIEDFSSRCAMVEGHLDVNVANLLYDGKIYVVDIADAGLAVPCLYDINNLALNEIYEGRDLSLLRALVSKSYADMLTSTVSGAIADFRSEDIRTSILINVVMRESSYVSKVLFKRPIRTRVANVRYGQFLRAMTEVDGSPAFGPHHDLETSPCIHAPNTGHDR